MIKEAIEKIVEGQDLTFDEAKEVMNDFKRINKEMNISVLINIHHVDLALEYADRVIGIKAGKIIYDGPSDQVDDEVLEKIYGRKLASDEIMGE